MASTSGLGPQSTSRNTVSRFLSRPLGKISHATVDHRDHISPTWSHLKERDDLFIVLDHVNTYQSSLGRYVEQKILRIVCGAELVAYINLDERLKDPSMETFRRYGAQVSLDQLPLGVLVRPPNLRISYSIENGQKKMLQLKFITDAACQEVAASLEAIGLPVRAGILLDRPGTQRLSTAGSWSVTPPTSQTRNAWSPNGSSSSQTVQALENSVAREELAMESQSYRARSIPEHPCAVNTAISSAISNPLAHSLEYPMGFPGTSQTRSQTPSMRQIGSQGTPVVQPYQQNRQPAQPQATQEFRYYPARHPTGSTERVVPVSPSPGNQSSHPSLYGSTNYVDRNVHGASPMQTQVTGIVPATNLSSSVRRESDSVLDRLNSPESQTPLSNPTQLYRRPSTSLAHNIMGPPPIPERGVASRDGRVSGKRKWTEPLRPPSRRSERLALRQGLQASEGSVDLTQHPDIIHPSPLTQTLDLPPIRELPFPVSRTQNKASTVTKALAGDAPASEEMTSTAAMESQPVSGAKGAAKKTRKAPAKSGKETTSQPKKRAPRKPKAVAPAPPATNQNEEQNNEGPAPKSAPPLTNNATNTHAVQQSHIPDTNSGHTIPAANMESNGQGPTDNPETNGSLTRQTDEREALTRPSMSGEDIENLIKKKLKETLGPYFAGVSSCMKEIDANFQRISEMTKQFAASS